MVLICKECKSACLEHHRELHWFYKCPVCAYSCIPYDYLSELDALAARSNPLLPTASLAAIRAIEIESDRRYSEHLAWLKTRKT